MGTKPNRNRLISQTLCRVQHAAHGGHLVRRKAASSGVLMNQFLVGRVVHAIDFVASRVTVHPFNFAPLFLHASEDAVGVLRDLLQLVFR